MADRFFVALGTLTSLTTYNVLEHHEELPGSKPGALYTLTAFAALQCVYLFRDAYRTYDSIMLTPPRIETPVAEINLDAVV